MTNAPYAAPSGATNGHQRLRSLFPIGGPTSGHRIDGYRARVPRVVVTSWLEEVLRRLEPATAAPDLSLAALGVVVLVAALAALVDPLWRVLRIGITLVHELGHAFVGILVGRRFTGFVLRGDMSGHAVTVGKPRGFGRAATTWAGYPAPGLVAVALVWLASAGYAAPTLAALLALLLVSLPRVRSALTLAVVVVTAAAIALLWWQRVDALQAQVLIGVALLLLIGGWRHLGALLASPGPGSDAGVLRRLSGIPTIVWNATFAATLAASSWGVGRLLA
jgi:hypothetical protein